MGDTDAALHATILKTGETWRRKFQKALLATPTEEELETEQQDKEKNKAFDLLDAISRSGAMKIDCASFHVVVASTHCFDETLINTVIQENCNPIEKIERSALIVSSTIHEQPPEELIKPEHLDRIKKGPSSSRFEQDFVLCGTPRRHMCEWTCRILYTGGPFKHLVHPLCSDRWWMCVWCTGQTLGSME